MQTLTRIVSVVAPLALLASCATVSKEPAVQSEVSLESLGAAVVSAFGNSGARGACSSSARTTRRPPRACRRFLRRRPGNRIRSPARHPTRQRAARDSAVYPGR